MDKPLMRKCVHVTGESGIETSEGKVLAENTTVLALCRNLEFRISRSRDARQFLVRIKPSGHHGQTPEP